MATQSGICQFWSPQGARVMGVFGFKLDSKGGEVVESVILMVKNENED